MRGNTLLLILLLAALIVFAVFNFDALTFPHTLNLFGLATYTVPLGMILLILAGAVALLFSLLSSITGLRAQAESARLLREMQSLRQSLDTQESARFAQLQTYLQERFAALENRAPVAGGTSVDALAQVTARVDRVRDELSADIGQLEDFLRRRLGDTPLDDTGRRPG